MNSQSELYIGYLPPGARTRKTIRAIVASALVLAASVAAALVRGQHPFAASTFEFQQYREFRGTLLAEPYPALLVPGQGRPWLLVGPGKHGMGSLREFNGALATLTGERIFRGEDHMIELQPRSLRVERGGGDVPARADLGQARLAGEIVDSKCYFGVMNPGSGKVHRDCAARCISGGIPPALLVRDADGRFETVLLANWKRELLNHVAEPVTLQGRLVRSAGRLTLYLE